MGYSLGGFRESDTTEATKPVPFVTKTGSSQGFRSLLPQAHSLLFLTQIPSGRKKATWGIAVGSRGVKACSCVWGWGGETPDRLDFWAFPLGVDGHVGVKGRETSTQAWETLEALRQGRCGRGTWAGINGSQHFSCPPSPLQPVLPPSGCGLKEQIAGQLHSPPWREKARGKQGEGVDVSDISSLGEEEILSRTQLGRWGGA